VNGSADFAAYNYNACTQIRFHNAVLANNNLAFGEDASFEVAVNADGLFNFELAPKF